MAIAESPSRITNDSFTVTGSLTATGDLVNCDVSPFDRVSVQVTSAGSTCTISYEVSNDASTWYAVGGYAPATPATETVTTSTSALITVFRLDCRYFRARVSTYGSGTVSVSCHFRAIYTSD